MVKVSCGSPVECSGMFVVFGGDPWVGPAVLGKELVTLLGPPWLVPRLGAVLSVSTPCPVLVLSCLAVLLPSLPDGGPGVQA